MSVAKKLWKYVFPPVNIKFSVFAVLLGYVAAVVYGYGGRWLPWGAGIPSLLVLTVVALTDFVAEGAWQHGFDILNDRSGGLSGFREDPSDPRVARLAKALVYFAAVWGAGAIAFLLYAGRIAAVAVGLIAVYLAWRYSHRRNECYAFIAVALAAAGGWFAATNMPGPELLPAALLAGMASRLSLAFYRYDDYAGINTIPDFTHWMELLTYYRNLFWLILWIPWLATAMLLYFATPAWIPTVMTLLPIIEMIYRRKWWCHVSNH